MTIWKAQRTLLLVGEGAHEVAFLKHTRSLYVTRLCGLSVTIKNARGKGAKHVVEHASRLLKNSAYDACAALLDTDTDFTEKVIKNARTNGIHLLSSTPCFEAVLLRLLGKNVNDDAKNLKKNVLPFLNGDPTNAINYSTHFMKSVLEKGRETEKVIDELLSLLIIK